MNRIRMTAASAALALACAIPATAAAQEGAGRGYVGFGFGQTTIDGFCSEANGAIVFLGGTPGGCDEKDSGFKIFGGYQLNPNFAIEASYFDYGEATARASFPGGPLTLDGGATAFGVAAVGILPVSPQFSLFGKVGILMTDAKVTAVGPGGVGTGSEDETGLHFGIGATFDFTRNLGLRLEWERNDEVEIDMLSIGLQVRF